MDGSSLITDSYKKAKIKTPIKENKKDVGASPIGYSTQDPTKETIVWSCDTPKRRSLKPGKTPNSKVNLDSLVKLAKRNGEDTNRSPEEDDDMMSSLLVAGIISRPEPESPSFRRASSFEDHGLGKLLITLKKVPSADDAIKKKDFLADPKEDELWGDMNDSLLWTEMDETLQEAPEKESWIAEDNDDELLVQATQAAEAAYSKSFETDPLLDDNDDSLLLRVSQAAEEAYVSQNNSAADDSWTHMDPEMLMALDQMESVGSA